MLKVKIHVANLSFDTTEDDLQKLFGRFGEVKGLNLVRERESGRSRGFAFVIMERDPAEAAIAALDGESFAERKLRVSKALPPQERERRPGRPRGDA